MAVISDNMSWSVCLITRRIQILSSWCSNTKRNTFISINNYANTNTPKYGFQMYRNANTSTRSLRFQTTLEASFSSFHLFLVSSKPHLFSLFHCRFPSTPLCPSFKTKGPAAVPCACCFLHYLFLLHINLLTLFLFSSSVFSHIGRSTCSFLLRSSSTFYLSKAK